ncbi:hypothetical protein K1W54_16815 [Micromonospora sp. CPCC 205371]|nr:hypothetical protein [Micromonospora sp. CPCC 205371]
MLDTVVRPATEAEPIAAPIEFAGPEPVLLVPVVSGGAKPRPVGAFVVAGGRVRYRPVLDVGELAAAALAAVTIVGVVVAVTRRRTPVVGAIRMGHGGWVSLRGFSPTGRGRPRWWPQRSTRFEGGRRCARRS